MNKVAVVTIGLSLVVSIVLEEHEKDPIAEPAAIWERFAARLRSGEYE